MAIKIDTEDLVSFSEGKKLVRRPTRLQLIRWAEIGIKSMSGKRIYLEEVKVGSERCTSREAYQRFVDACTARERFERAEKADHE